MARWYIIHAYSGFEGKVRDAILSEANRMGLEQLVEQIEVPTETITEARKIVWPTRRETITTAVMVLILTTLLAVFFFAIDKVFDTGVEFLLSLAK